LTRATRPFYPEEFSPHFGLVSKIDRALAIMDRQNALLGLSKGVTLSTTNVTMPIQIVEVNLTEDESPLMLEFEGKLSRRVSWKAVLT
jgi:hypothetical protein